MLRFLLSLALAALSLTPPASGASGPIGLGFVLVGSETEAPPDSIILRFHASPEASRPEHEITVHLGGDEVTATAPAWLRPESWWPDYSLFAFRALEMRGDWARVVVHEETGRTLWLRTGGAVTFAPWETFLTQHVTILQRESAVANPVRTAPEADAEPAHVPEIIAGEDWIGDCWVPAEVRGDWMRVQPSDLCRANWTEPAEPMGWIRWREGDRLLVTWGLTC